MKQTFADFRDALLMAALGGVVTLGLCHCVLFPRQPGSLLLIRTFRSSRILPRHNSSWNDIFAWSQGGRDRKGL